MMNPRLEELLKFLEEDPNDPFIIYGIALEYSKTDNQKALEYYDQLLNNHPEYLPTYYHAGKLLEKAGHKERAVDVYKKGIDLSQKMRNMHALSELRGAYNTLMDLDEDE